jgi:hypothetical protein
MKNLLSIFRWTAKQGFKNLTVIERPGRTGKYNEKPKSAQVAEEDRGSKIEDRR